MVARTPSAWQPELALRLCWLLVRSESCRERGGTCRFGLAPYSLIPCFSGSLVISAYAVCPDITATVTPDLKCPRGRGMGSPHCFVYSESGPLFGVCVVGAGPPCFCTRAAVLSGTGGLSVLLLGTSVLAGISGRSPPQPRISFPLPLPCLSRPSALCASQPWAAPARRHSSGPMLLPAW